MEWFLFESIESSSRRDGVNKNHLHNPLDPLASDGFACKEARKHLLDFPFKPVQRPLNFE
jgi:hypothetical protein